MAHTLQTCLRQLMAILPNRYNILSNKIRYMCFIFHFHSWIITKALEESIKIKDIILQSGAVNIQRCFGEYRNNNARYGFNTELK